MSGKPLKFWVEGTPIAKGRPRKGKYGAFYTPAKTRLWEERVAIQAKMTARWVVFEKEPLRVSLKFYFKHPKSHSKARKQETAHMVKPDIDNLCKAVIDAMNGIVFTDDRQIVELWVRKEYSLYESEGVRVEVQEEVK